MDPVEKVASPEVHEVKLYHDGEEPHHNPALERNFSFWSCLGLAFAILNSWNGACLKERADISHGSVHVRRAAERRVDRDGVGPPRVRGGHAAHGSVAVGFPAE
jgi:hypothetical protein